MLELKNVSKYYNSNGIVTVGLRNINLKLNKGEIVAIVGDSGSGKSTLLNVISGVDTYEEGEILFYGNETSYFDSNDMDAFRKNNVSFIYQKYNIIDSYTVLENVMLPLTLKGLAHEEALAEATRIIERVGLKDRIKNRGSKLSGGEKQRCVIARALASDAKILACDEPTGNLDSKTGDEIIKLIKEVSEDKLVLIVTHNYDQVKDIVTRKLKISDGELVEDLMLSPSKDEEAAPMELKSARMSFKEALLYSIRNIKATPKKTILVSLELLCVSILAFVLTLTSFMMAGNGSYSKDYNDISDNRIVLYNKEHKAIDKSLLEGFSYIENPFYIDKSTPLAIESEDGFLSQTTYFMEGIPKGRLYLGNMPAEGEALVVMPGSYYPDREEWNKLLDKRVSYHGNERVDIAKISGVYISDYVSGVTIAYNGSLSSYKRSVLNSHFFSYYYKDINNVEIKIDMFETTNPREGNKLILPLGFDIDRIYGKVLGLYRANIPYEVEYKANFKEPRFIYGTNWDSEIEMDTYMVTIYSANTKRDSDAFKNMGFDVTIPANVVKTDSLSKAILNTYLVLTIIAIVAMYFISYAILSKIYQSKLKDYGVLRALGVVKKDLGRMVRLEIVTMSIVATVVGLVGTILFCVLRHETIADFISAGPIIFYLVIMILFAIFIANRFNKRLFKFSVNTTLRDGE